MSRSASLQPALSGLNSNPALRRAFDTMELVFFKAGDDLCKPVAVDNDVEDLNESLPYDQDKRRLAISVFLAALALAVLAVLAL